VLPQLVQDLVHLERGEHRFDQHRGLFAARAGRWIRCHGTIREVQRGAKMTWEFITKPVRTANVVAWEWEWRFVAEDGSEKSADRTFPSFRECIADARRHGFIGDPDPGEAGTLFQRPEARFVWF
jgi:hypothetical protein